jgi:hypothetical protein
VFHDHPAAVEPRNDETPTSGGFAASDSSKDAIRPVLARHLDHAPCRFVQVLSAEPCAA